MQTKAFAIAGILALVALLSGCADSGGSTNTAQIEIKANAFSPMTKEVKAGTTVTWVNRDGYAHTVTPLNATSEFKDSGDLNGGQTYKVTFNTPGEYKYRCKPHSSMSGSMATGMIGTVIVKA